MPENIHDKFFKENFSRQDIAADFVRETFPETLLAKLDLNTFVLSSVSYVDPTLEEYFADIVYDCQYEGSQPVQIAILFEHKSQREKYPHFQLLRYLLNSWEEARKQHKPPILLIPVVIYHGKTRWKYESLLSYFGEVDAELTQFLPAFRYLLYDISHYSDERLLGFRNKFLATSLFLMKHRKNEVRLLAERRRLFVWLDDLVETETGQNYLMTTIIYLSKNLDTRPKNFFQMLFSTERIEKKAMTTYDQIIDEGIERGKESAFLSLLKVAQQQGINIDQLAAQYNDLPRQRIDELVGRVKKEND